jgi:uncharacterized membrane protein (UPF0127 family)
MDVPRKINGKEIILITIVLVMFLIIWAWAGRVGQIDQPDTTITYNSLDGNVSINFLDVNVSFRCEVADTPAERAIGLMNRTNLSSDEGMLFIFESPRNVSFWMKNTLIPLDIVFIDESGMVVNIEQANPEPGVSDADLARYSSDRPVKWVLEVNQGLCAAYGITPGA